MNLLHSSVEKKIDVKQLNFESWWMENKKRNSIFFTYKLNGDPHEVKIEDTKYYLKDIQGSSWKPIELWDLYVGAKIDIFGKPTILKRCCLKTVEWNKFYGEFLNEIKKTLLDEIVKYDRKSLDPKLTKINKSKALGSTDLRLLIKQVIGLKDILNKYWPMLSNDIVKAFEGLL